MKSLILKLAVLCLGPFAQYELSAKCLLPAGCVVGSTAKSLRKRLRGSFVEWAPDWELAVIEPFTFRMGEKQPIVRTVVRWDDIPNDAMHGRNLAGSLIKWAELSARPASPKMSKVESETLREIMDGHRAIEVKRRTPMKRPTREGLHAFYSNTRFPERKPT